MQTPPEPLTPQGNTLRFAMGDPTGLRSRIWSVIGEKGGREVYIGARDAFGDIKLSLHPSGDWRYAYTSQSGRTGADGDRVLERFSKPNPFAPGWTRGATVVIPNSSLSTMPGKPLRGRDVSWWPAPGDGRQLLFHILLRDDPALPGQDQDTTVGIGEVGRLWARGEQPIWVIADEGPVSEKQLQQYAELLSEAAAAQASVGDTAFGISIGRTDADGVPLCLDLGPVA